MTKQRISHCVYKKGTGSGDKLWGMSLFLLILLASFFQSDALCLADSQKANPHAALVSNAMAQIKEGTERKNFQGTVSAVGPNGVAIEYEKTETSSKEMWLPFEESLQLEGYSQLDQLAQGDTVQIVYDEEQDLSKRILRKVSLVSHKTPEEEDEAA